MNPTLSQWLLQPHFERCGNKLFFCDIIFSVHEKLQYRQHLDWGGLDLSNCKKGRPKYEICIRNILKECCTCPKVVKLCVFQNMERFQSVKLHFRQHPPTSLLSCYNFFSLHFLRTCYVILIAS